MNGQFQVATLFETDEDLIEMRKGFSDQFFMQFNKAFYFYEIGDWKQARIEFEKVEGIKGKPDAPTKTILEFMKETDYQKPKDWEGYRILVEK